MYGYVLCKQCQDKAEGRRIETESNMNSFKTLDLFLQTLHKQNVITDEEFQEIETVYYD